jgi:zinc protease
MQPDYTTAPPAQKVSDISIIEGQVAIVGNGLPVHYVNAGTAEVLRIDLVFNAGKRAHPFGTAALATSAMLTEGTATRKSSEIADELDFFGAYLQPRCGVDDGVVTLFCLKKHFDSCLPYLLDVVSDSIFPDAELNLYRQKEIQRLMVNNQKNSFLNRRLFYSGVFGKDHPYGMFSESADYELISRETLQDFFNSHYKNGLRYALISGSVDDVVLKSAEQLASLVPTLEPLTPCVTKIRLPEKVFFEKSDSVQSAIRVGRRMFNRKHPDFQKMQVLNLILGGYFGSRLMTNIREEKGLTYGIYSVLESWQDDGCFFIETEINNALKQTGLNEIYKELKNLRETLIPPEELETAKNYLLGSFLRSIDGPFALADRYRILVDNGLDYSYYSRFIHIVNTVSASELRDLANLYLSEPDLFEVVVGSK